MSLSAKHIMTSPDDSQIILEKAQFLSQPADYGRPHLRWNPGQALTQLTWIGKKKPRTMDKETKKCIALTTLLKTNQIAERSFTSKSRIEVSFKNWLTPPANCQEFQEDVCFFLLYAYAFVEALFLSLISNWGSRSFGGVRQLEFHQVCVASIKQSSRGRKLPLETKHSQLLNVWSVAIEFAYF